MHKLAILLTHPIQYYSPIFRLLQEGDVVYPKVFYTHLTDQTLYDKGFGQEISWDIPLLEGYEYQFQPAGSRLQNRALIAAIDQWRPQAVLVYGWNPPGHLAVMRHFKGKVPVWFRGDSTLLDEQPGPRQWLRRWFLRWIYRHIDLAFYVGTHNRCYFEAHGLKPQQLRFAPHAIDNDRFADGPDKNYEARALIWRRKLGIADGDFVILFAGKLEPKKAPDHLLQTFQRLKEEGTYLPRLHLIFAGSGKMEAELKQIAVNTPDVYFIGFQNQSIMPVVYRLGNVFCLPSKGPEETWGLAVNESLASGTPVLVSDRVGCAINLAIPVACSKMFLAGSQQSLRESLEEQILLLSKSKKLKKMDCKLNTFMQEWSFNKFIKTIENSI